MPESPAADCSFIDSVVTPYVDGELASAEREMVHQHLRVCSPCFARVSVEEAVQRLIGERKDALREEVAPKTLRMKCASMADAGANGLGASSRAGAWRARIAPLALAATLVLIVAGAFIYQITARSTRVMAMELTADHMKCFAVNGLLGTQQAPAAVESSLAAGFGWQTHLPDRPDREGLSLVGSRPCLYGEGRVAHIMYLHNGRPVSLFMLPRRRASMSDETIRVLGHEAAMWSVGDRTFVLIAREAKSEVDHLASFVRTSIR